VFLLLAGLFWLDPLPFVWPDPPVEPAPAWATDPTPVRSPALQPLLERATFTYRCNECHRLFPSPPETLRRLTQHREIPREHGINNRCFNCHHREDRNAFVDDKGDPIPWSEPQRLCAKCHGPVYRDWTHDVHGRAEGSWKPDSAERHRRRCIECHDPHAPAFAPLAPAPPPDTLRMGQPDHGARVAGETDNPLKIYRREEAR